MPANERDVRNNGWRRELLDDAPLARRRTEDKESEETEELGGSIDISEESSPS